MMTILFQSVLLAMTPSMIQEQDAPSCPRAAQAQEAEALGQTLYEGVDFDATRIKSYRTIA